MSLGLRQESYSTPYNTYVRELAETKPLHEILKMDEGLQTDVLKLFTAKNDQVYLRTSSGGLMKTRIGNKEVNVTPRGRWVSTPLAIRLLRAYGHGGKYWGRDRATGLRAVDLMHMPEETKDRYKWWMPDVNFDDFKVNSDYLIHELRDPNEEDDADARFTKTVEEVLTELDTEV